MDLTKLSDEQLVELRDGYYRLAARAREWFEKYADEGDERFALHFGEQLREKTRLAIACREEAGRRTYERDAAIMSERARAIRASYGRISHPTIE